MPLTKAELRDRVLQQIEVLPSGQAASGEDAELMGKLIDEAFAEYVDFIPFLSSSTPDWAVRGMVLTLSARAAPLFGGAPIMMNERDAFALFVEARDKVFPPAQSPVKVEYY